MESGERRARERTRLIVSRGAARSAFPPATFCWGTPWCGSAEGRAGFERSGAGFHGKLMNVNVSGESGIDHFTIDKSPRLQVQALNAVAATVRGGTCRPSGGNSVAAGSKEQSATPAALP